MARETCKCSEDLRRDFYDLAYHGLRAEHYDLVHRVKDLESAREEMSEEEKKEYKRLQGYQKDRQRQVEGLDKLWRRLFSPVCCTVIMRRQNNKMQDFILCVGVTPILLFFSGHQNRQN